MRMLGGWIALTPELDAKLLFGRHVWDCAQHTDLWGRRLPELRATAQQSEPANDGVVALLDLVQRTEGPTQTIERVVAIYRVLKPHLATVYERHLAVANPVYEPPTRRILDRCIAEERRLWEARNRAARIQKRRQDQLGLGWGNHDHHTFRSSREHFADLIEFLLRLGFQKRERYYAGAEAGWGAQISEQPVTGRSAGKPQPGIPVNIGSRSR